MATLTEAADLATFEGLFTELSDAVVWASRRPRPAVTLIHPGLRATAAPNPGALDGHRHLPSAA